MRIGRLILGAALLTTSGCSADTGTNAGTDPTPDELAAAGTYSLAQVNGSAVPVSYPKDARLCVRSVISGAMTLHADPFTYSVTIQVRSVCDSGISTPPTTVDATLLESGTWTIANGAFTPAHESGSAIVAAGPVIGSSGSVSFTGTIVWSDAAVTTVPLVFRK